MFLHQLTRRAYTTIGLCIILALCGSLGTDIHLASLPILTHVFHTQKHVMAQSVSLFVLGVSLSILFYGPLSDCYGRKPIVIAGLSLAAISCFAACFTSHVVFFLSARLFQGLGCGVCWGLARVIVIESVDEQHITQVFFLLSGVLSLSPMLAPVFGAYLLHWFNWQANFICLGTLIGITLFLFLFFFQESNQNKSTQPYDLSSVLTTYASLLKDRLFLKCIALSSVIFSAVFSYVTLSPFIFQIEFHTNPRVYGWLTLCIAIFGIVGKTLVGPLLITAVQRKKTLTIASICILISGATLSLLSLIHGQSIVEFVLSVSLLVMATSILGPMITPIALLPFDARRGSASALYATLPLFISSVVSAGISHFPHADTSALAVSFLIIGCCTVVLVHAINKHIPHHKQGKQSTLKGPS